MAETELERLIRERNSLTKRINELKMKDSSKISDMCRVRIEDCSIGLTKDGQWIHRLIWKFQIKKSKNEDFSESNKYCTVDCGASKEDILAFIDSLLDDLPVIKDMVNKWDY